MNSLENFDIVFLNPNQLIDYERNAKVHTEKQIKDLARQIQTVGFRVPIIVDSNYVICSGHGRRQAALLAGLNSIPVHVLPPNFDANTIRSMRIFDNKIAETSWDHDLLNMELSDLSSLGFDMSLTGFDSPSFVPDLPDEEEEEKLENPKDFILRIVCDDEDHQKELFDELKERGLKVKV